MVTVFFYGLFMDADLLRAKGLAPADPRPAHVDGYALRIGERATLVREDGARVHGMVMELTHDEIDRLYAEPGVSMYRPIAVLTDSGPALCYVLPVPPRENERNETYAEKLRDVKRKLGLPLL